jgi:hypothetical protein
MRPRSWCLGRGYLLQTGRRGSCPRPSSERHKRSFMSLELAVAALIAVRTYRLFRLTAMTTTRPAAPTTARNSVEAAWALQQQDRRSLQGRVNAVAVKSAGCAESGTIASSADSFLAQDRARMNTRIDHHLSPEAPLAKADAALEFPAPDRETKASDGKQPQYLGAVRRTGSDRALSYQAGPLVAPRGNGPRHGLPPVTPRPDPARPILAEPSTSAGSEQKAPVLKPNTTKKNTTTLEQTPFWKQSLHSLAWVFLRPLYYSYLGLDPRSMTPPAPRATPPANNQRPE